MVPEEEDDEEIQEELEGQIEKQPLELDEMLELFRDDEEPLRPGFNPMWLVLGLIVVVGGCWLAVVGVQAFGELITRHQGAPKSAKVSERAPRPAVDVDVQAVFRERCAKGMSEDEIRWVLEDFEKLGLFAELELQKDLISKVLSSSPEPATPAERELLKKAILKTASREREWYAAALADGLMLNGEQKAELKQKLAAALAADAEKLERADGIFLRMEQRQPNDGPPEQELAELGELFPGLLGGEPFVLHTLYFSAALPQMWLDSEAYAPWNLCQLSPDQLALTNHDYFSAQHGENAEGGWRIAPEIESAEGDRLQLPYSLQLIAGILPFTAQQDFPHDGDIISLGEKPNEVLTKLHPAQFKLFLLCDPDSLPGTKPPSEEK
ncbi:hypothetical protein [Haloferula sp. BvORR071]|uniref:hypothetical protein n=1 Tax=Haloferula sp. BvORR071 TaxID=1396141 RepID=UPI0005575CC5|nr:hypothetical protein [Haloferula sp. BvORR071]